MKEFIEHKQTYERVFSCPVRRKRCVHERHISFQDNYPESFHLYVDMCKKYYRKIRNEIFDMIVKSTWLKRRFVYVNSLTYPGKNKFATSIKESSPVANRALSMIYLNDVNFSPKFFTETWFRAIVTYFPDFFPRFDDGNPFVKKYKYPYKIAGLESLYMVHRLKHRLKLLEVCEKKKMKYGRFIDYVINWANTENEIAGEERYRVICNSGHLAVVRPLREEDKYLYEKTKKTNN